MKAPAFKTGLLRETRYHCVWMTGANARRSARVTYAVVASVLWFACANAVAGKATAFAQAGVAPSGRASSGTGAPTPIAPATALPSTISPTISEAPDESTRPAPPRRLHKRKTRKTPNWVIQSKVLLTLEADPRFKKVHASITQPGVIVLEGEVFDDPAKGAAERTVAGVQGVKRVINALTTESLKWLLMQTRINQTLQQNGFALVSVKVIGNTVFLSGQVSSDADKDRAASVVKSAAPDSTIGTNLIEVK
jgi:BON domain